MVMDLLRCLMLFSVGRMIFCVIRYDMYVDYRVLYAISFVIGWLLSLRLEGI
jgi:hypothetical protein